MYILHDKHAAYNVISYTHTFPFIDRKCTKAATRMLIGSISNSIVNVQLPDMEISVASL